MFLALALILIILASFWIDRSTGTVGTGTQKYNILITEICAKNESILADNDGKYRDYIELFNAGEPVNLTGFTITDGNGTEFTLGNIVLESGEYRVLFIGKDLTGFSISASGGDCVQLKNPAGGIEVQTNVAAMPADHVMVYSRGIYHTSSDASPGYPNDESGIAAFREGIICQNPTIVVSEVLVQNASTMPDELGRYSDIVELHNTTDQSIRLNGWYLSDSETQRLRFRMPDVTLEANDYLLVFCDGENYTFQSGQIHANFGLSLGDVLCLTDPTGAYIVYEIPHTGEEDRALLLTEDGSFEAGPPTPGWPNSREGATEFVQSRIDRNAPLSISEVLPAESGAAWNGALQDVVEIINHSAESVTTENWYLTDGGDAYEFPLPKKELAPGEMLVLPITQATTGFALSEGENLYLTTPGYQIASPVTCVLPEPGASIVLQAEGYAFMKPSLGYPNDRQGQEQYAQETYPQDLVISEVMTGNLSYLLGPYGVGSDWVELYNASAAPIRLSDYQISDNPDAPDAYTLPDITLEAGEYCVVLLTDKTENLPSSFKSVPLSLSSEGEGLYLSCGKSITDQVMIPALVPDVSYGRPAGSASFAVLSSVTPGEPNSSGAELCAMPQSLTTPGVYDGVEYLDVSLASEGDIYYTTDCTAPGADATLYTGPIRITKTTVIRAECRQPGKLPSRVLDLTFLLNENDTLPAVSLVLEPDDLWSTEKGIYVRGNGGATECPYEGTNFWQDWEKAASVTLYEKDGTGFSYPCGLKIFGACSRGLPLKAFSCLFRDAYGVSELSYPLFGEEGLDTYESFILRASGQDVFTTRMRDVLMTSLVGEATNVPVQKYRPVVMYLNGEFWGVYYIREKISEQYIAGNYHTNPDTVVLTEKNGLDCPQYMELYNYVQKHDMTDPDAYAYVCSLMDVDEYINYMVAQMCIANTDNANVKYFTYPGGKWTWILFDTDLGFYDPNYPALAEHMNPAGTGSVDEISTYLINGLMRNSDFKDQFLRTMAWQLNNIWTEENILNRIEELDALISPDLEQDLVRWGYSPGQRQVHMENLRIFARNRRSFMVSQVRSYFHLTDEQMQSYGFIP